jgi:hypothetical protein
MWPSGDEFSQLSSVFDNGGLGLVRDSILENVNDAGIAPSSLISVGIEGYM